MPDCIMFSESSNRTHVLVPGKTLTRCCAMIETIKNELIQYIERMDEYQLYIVLGFVKKLFNIHD